MHIKQKRRQPHHHQARRRADEIGDPVGKTIGDPDDRRVGDGGEADADEERQQAEAVRADARPRA